VHGWGVLPQELLRRSDGGLDDATGVHARKTHGECPLFHLWNAA
jgi:hypothetical protein